MRALTPAEFRTASAILAFPGATDRARIRAAAIPSSTYNVVRRRIYEAGWLDDVLVPNPGPTGVRSVEIELDRPHLAERATRVAATANDPASAVVWGGVHTVFSIRFTRTDRSARAASGPPTTTPGWRLRIDAVSGELPVYFDYGGLWARFGGERVPEAYPAGLAFGTTPAARRWSTSRSAPPSDEVEAAPWFNLSRASRAQQRAIEAGAVQLRTVVRPALVPPLDGRRLGELLFIHGRLAAGRSLHGLLTDLRNGPGVCPFLAAAGDGAVVLAGIGQLADAPGRRTPVRAGPISTTAILRTYLEEPRLDVEPVEAVQQIVAHRYAGIGPL